VRWFRRADAPRGRHDSRGASDTAQRTYTITCSLGGFNGISIAWQGTSLENASDSFLEYLENDAEFNDTGGRHPYRRSLYVRFNGRRQLLTFRTDWVSGFTVH
jgi:hypothetical protein